MPLSPTATRALLQRLGHLPRKTLGQNFLIDGNIVRKSIELAELRAGEAVVEIGPGLGTLTQALLEVGVRVWAVEHDPGLAAHLRTELVPAADGRLDLLEGDAVTSPRAGLPAAESASYKIVANLPYAISTPWLDGILAGPLPVLMVLMLQREAAQRYTAAPGTKQFGAISAFLQAAYTAAPLHRVAPSCFHPRPEVDSALLKLVRRPDPFTFTLAQRKLIRACFQQRRKQIGALLRGLLPDAGETWFAQVAEYGVTPRDRPEAISTKAWKRLTPA